MKVAISFVYIWIYWDNLQSFLLKNFYYFFYYLLNFSYFSKMRHKIKSKPLIGFSVSIGIINLLFVALIEQINKQWLCTTTSALLHFFILHSFCWILIEIMRIAGKLMRKILLKVIIVTFGKFHLNILFFVF